MRRERYREELVVTFTQEGAFGLRSLETVELVDSTSAVLFWPRTPYSTTHPLGCTDHGCSLSFQRSAVEEVLEAFAPRALEALGRDRLLPPAVRPCRPGSRLRQVLLSELCRRGPVHAMAVDELAFELLEELLEGLELGNDRAPVPVRPETLEAHRRCVERARSELNRRFREPLRLDDLARAAHASPFHLCRLFKAVTGMTIRRYLLRLRLAAGMGEVVAGEQSLSRIAVDLGFFSHSHFTAAFSKEFGLPPKEVRSLARVWDGIGS